MKSRKAQMERFIAKHFAGELPSANEAHLSTEEIIGFHDGTANSAERKQIETHLENCLLCCELLQAVEAMEEVRIQAEIATASSPASGFFRRLIKWLVQRPFYPIAATAGAVLLIIFFLNKNQADLYSNLVEISPAPYIPSELRGEEKAQELFDQGMSLYLARDFQSALPLLERAATQQPENAKFRFFFGVALLLNQKYEAGIEHLTQASVLASAYRDEANWYAAQAYLKMNQPEQAKKLLRMLVGTQGALANKAANLLQQLERVESSR